MGWFFAELLRDILFDLFIIYVSTPVLRKDFDNSIVQEVIARESKKGREISRISNLDSLSNLLEPLNVDELLYGVLCTALGQGCHHLIYLPPAKGSFKCLNVLCKISCREVYVLVHELKELLADRWLGSVQTLKCSFISV